MSYFCGGPNLYIKNEELPTEESDFLAAMPNPPSNASPNENPLIPEIIPNAPTIQVPPNPLLPPGSQEVITYDTLQYLNGFLRTQVGRYAIVDFLIGSNSTVQEAGVLVGVGLNYLILQEIATSSITVCDFYAIKFVSFPY